MKKPEKHTSYDHARNIHTEVGARKLSEYIYSKFKPSSLIDVGAGTGAFLNSMYELGCHDYLGLDGVPAKGRTYYAETDKLSILNFEKNFSFPRKWDLACCLEVAEHLSPEASDQFIKSVCLLSDRIVFSAAFPGQDGDGHLNCQYPAYWQEKFNRNGFKAVDEIRHEIWDNGDIEPWYRQNIFVLHKDQDAAGKENRLSGIVHPEMLPYISSGIGASRLHERVARGDAGVRAHSVGLARSIIRAIRTRLIPNAPTTKA